MFDLEYLMWVRHEEMLKERQHQRLIALAKKHAPRRSNPYRQALTWLGGRLCKWGRALQERFGDAEGLGARRTVNSGV
jgi:hypothetical protein